MTILRVLIAIAPDVGQLLFFGSVLLGVGWWVCAAFAGGKSR